MKKLLLFATMLFAAMAFTLTSCDDPAPEPTPDPKPEPPTPVELTFDVEIEAVTKNSMTYSVTPSIKDADYLVVLVPETYIDNAGMGEGLATAIMESLRDQAASTGKTLAEYLPEVMSKGDIKSKDMTGLAPETDYSLVVFGLDKEFKPTTEPVCEPFTTEAIAAVDCTFDVTVTVAGTEAEFNIVPSNNDINWHMFVIADADYNAYVDPAGDYKFTDATLYEAYFASEINNYLAGGYTMAEIIAGLCPKGTQTMSAKNLNANYTYRYMIAGVLVEGEEVYIVTAPSHDSFTTEGAAASDLTFEITVENVEQNRADILIVPSKLDETFTWVCNPYDGVSTEEELMNNWVSQNQMWFDWGMMLYTGVQDYTAAGPNFKYKVDSPDTDYYVMAFGYTGGVTTAPEVEYFRTLPAPDPSDVEMSLSAMNITPYSFVLRVDASDDTSYYSVGLTADLSGINEEILKVEAEAGLQEMLSMQQMFDPNATVTQILSSYYYCGDYDISASRLTPETSYSAYIIVFNNDGTVAKILTYADVAATPALGNINPTAELIGYYSGDDENGELFGQADATAGKCIMVVKYDNFDGASTLYAATMGADYADPEQFPDGELLYTLPIAYWTPINLTSPYSFYLATWEQEMIACVFAEDANGAMGVIDRLAVKPTAEQKGDYADLKALVDELNSTASGVLARPNNRTFEPASDKMVFLKKDKVEPLGIAPESIARPEMTIKVAEPEMELGAIKALKVPAFVRF